MQKNSSHPHIVICADPYNSESANILVKEIKAAGGDVVIFKNYSNLANCLQTGRGAVSLGYIDALILMGNDKYDVAPETYNHRYPENDKKRKFVHPATVSENGLSATPVSKARSQFERYMIREALKRKIPLVGICGGMQRINIECGEEEAFGSGVGTLIQHLPDLVGHNGHAADTESKNATQRIEIRENTKLAALIKASKGFDPLDISSDSAPAACQQVSTRHHQAIENLADGLIVSAHILEKHPQTNEKIKVIKAIEAHPKGKYKDQFVIGMQFHPEYVQNLCPELARKIVQKARDYSHAKPHENRFFHQTVADRANVAAIFAKPRDIAI